MDVIPLAESDIQLTAGCAGELAQYCRAWERHGVRFGMRGALSVCDGGPEETERLLVFSGDPLMYRFPHGYNDPACRGYLNPHFLDPVLMRERYSAELQAATGGAALVFSIPRIYPTEGVTPAAFIQRLAQFLGALPLPWGYGVELHNPEFLLPAYFECLREHGAAHVITDDPPMSPLVDQVLLPHVITAGRMVVWTSARGNPDLPSAVIAAVRRCRDECKDLSVYLDDEPGYAVTALIALMEQLNGELAQRSPIRRRAA